MLQVNILFVLQKRLECLPFDDELKFKRVDFELKLKQGQFCSL